MLNLVVREIVERAQNDRLEHHNRIPRLGPARDAPRTPPHQDARASRNHPVAKAARSWRQENTGSQRDPSTTPPAINKSSTRRRKRRIFRGADGAVAVEVEALSRPGSAESARTSPISWVGLSEAHAWDARHRGERPPWRRHRRRRPWERPHVPAPLQRVLRQAPARSRATGPHAR